jgi:hypothetical protein
MPFPMVWVMPVVLSLQVQGVGFVLARISRRAAIDRLPVGRAATLTMAVTKLSNVLRAGLL